MVPRLLRFDLAGVLGPHAVTMRAPTTVVFVTPQNLSDTIGRPSEEPWMPSPKSWNTNWESAGCIPPSIVDVLDVERTATQRVVYIVRVNPQHAAFALWEIDFAAFTCPTELYVLFTRDDSPLPAFHAMPRGTPIFGGRFLNRLLLSVARHMARGWSRGVRATFVEVATWDHRWLGSSFLDKSAYIAVDETLPLNTPMARRIQFWLHEAFESQYLHPMTAQVAAQVHARTRLISLVRPVPRRDGRGRRRLREDPLPVRDWRWAWCAGESCDRARG